jgi:zinc transporter 5/7
VTLAKQRANLLFMFSSIPPLLRFSLLIPSVWSNSDSRKIAAFLLANLLFMFVELTYGWWTNSLGLISDAFHMLFDCMALAIGLYASILKDWEANNIFTYGYVKKKKKELYFFFNWFSVFWETPVF